MTQLKMDRLGWTYMGLGIAWTVALFGAMLFLHVHRHLPCLRIRRLPLVFVGVLSIHVYGFLCLIGYCLSPILSCTAEFWVMSIFLPFGLAVFHAANSQFLHIASRQKQYAHMSSLKDHKPIEVDEEEARRLANSRWKRITKGVERADKIDRMMAFIVVGLVVQLALTLLVYFGAKKFHPSYGLWEWEVTGTNTEVRMKCSKGWEWWLSIVWQFFWAWIYAPYLLWKSRGIRDVHGWRLQTICCCLAGLPPSPLWLVALYVPAMAPVNAYLVPPFYFTISIFFIEVFTIAFPIIQVFKAQSLRQETLEAIASWERRQQLHQFNTNSDSTIVQSEADSLKSGAYSGTLTIKSGEKSPVIRASFDSQKSDMFTMAALENALRTNADPLLQFAALKDFSGENVSFLTHVAEWRRAWFSPKSSTTDHRHKQFVGAVRIYASFVSLEFSDFPINISSREMKHLHQVFESCATMLMRSGSISSADSATPFESYSPDEVPADSSSTSDLKSGVNLDTLGRANLQSVSHMITVGKDEALADVKVPDAFSEMIFNAAESEIKYLVLTNTWPKFVNSSCATSNMGKDDKGEQANWFARNALCSA
ncbi:hypothetical protein BS50DRAFT_483289 [Corynespora cassiicola Philippines]|uniref:RGS domain-containing protein n=1 Tax=Corynespora cassiicola Philippines TaxID=1448308 RepID=A0A2T2P7F8_CORCC|nr:hypothetical protein BS50DRAFT_483289 [Corynespora cassiicola Philippines]